ncbi:lysophospholipase, partial [Nguyenibacter vanlangensis]|nr:lysophospholipase [Nguyenibacter vanlangensis]
PGGYHLLLRSRTRDAALADIAQWIADPDRWLPSGGDAAPGLADLARE